MIKSILPIIVHAIYGAVCIQLKHFSDDDCENTDNDNDNENNFIVMKLHFHSLYKSNNIPNEDYFSLAKKT